MKTTEQEAEIEGVETPEPTEYQLWSEYERRKRDIPNGLSPARYQRECERIADELGI